MPAAASTAARSSPRSAPSSGAAASRQPAAAWRARCSAASASSPSARRADVPGARLDRMGGPFGGRRRRPSRGRAASSPRRVSRLPRAATTSRPRRASPPIRSTLLKAVRSISMSIFWSIPGACLVRKILTRRLQGHWRSAISWIRRGMVSKKERGSDAGGGPGRGSRDEGCARSGAGGAARPRPGNGRAERQRRRVNG